jgi:hypothetical protein
VRSGVDFITASASPVSVPGGDLGQLGTGVGTVSPKPPISTSTLLTRAA